MPLTVTSAPRQLSDGNTAGTILGTGPNDAIGFFGSVGSPQILQGTLAGRNGLLKIYTLAAASPALVAANSTNEMSLTATNMTTAEMVIAVNKPTAIAAGLIMGQARSGTGAAFVSFGNTTAVAITPTANEAYTVVSVSGPLQFPAQVLSPVSVAGATTVEQQFTVPGAQVGMWVTAVKPTTQAGLLIAGSRVVAPDVVAVTFINVTASTVITPTAAESWLFFGCQGLRLQPVSQTVSVALTPASVAANTAAEQTFTVPNIQLSTSIAMSSMPQASPGLSIAGVRVSAANQIAINFCNVTATAQTPPAGTYTFELFPNPIAAAGSTNTQLATQGMGADQVLANLGLTGVGT